MALGTALRAIRDFATGATVKLVFGLYPDGFSSIALHAHLDSNGALVDPATDQDWQAVHAGLQAIVVKQGAPITGPITGGS